jgi:drug/metabolite transporter (DMT)-like permease
MRRYVADHLRSGAPVTDPAKPTEFMKARLMLVVLCLSWGLTWPAMKISLTAVPPVSLRTASAVLGCAFLSVVAIVRRHRITLPFGRAWVHVAVAGLFNVVLFGLFATFAQLTAATSRVAILAYTMPIWTVILARPILGERLTAMRSVALVLCVVGIAVLIYPLAGAGVPGGIVLALLSGVSWAFGTVYLKWARLTGDPLTNAIWQFVASFLILLLVLPFFEGTPQVWPQEWDAWLAMLFTGLIGSGLSYFLWFHIVGRLPAMTATLGILSVPLVGVGASAIILAERPTAADLIGFLLIFAASACVLLEPPERAGKATVPAE